MDARTRVDTQVVGALPLVAAMLQQWGLAELVDQVVPWEGDVPLGTLVEVLVTNRLLNPKAMYAVGEWAAAVCARAAERVDDCALAHEHDGHAVERHAVRPVVDELVQRNGVVPPSR